MPRIRASRQGDLMEIQMKYKVIAVGAGLLVAFAVGRYTAPSPNIKEKESIKTDTNKDIAKDTKKKTVIVQTPDGKKVTTIDEETKTDTKQKTDTQASIDVSVTTKKAIVSVQGLAGYDFTRSPVPVYGAAVSKEFIGPVTLGAFGLTNGTIGVSIGVNF